MTVAVANPSVATALGKVSFWKKNTTRGAYNSGVYDSANTVFLNAPLVPNQPLRKVDSRQQRNTASKVTRISNRYGIGEASIDVPIKPSGSLGVRPHGYQVLEGWWGKETVDPGVSVLYEPAAAGEHPDYTVLVKYGHKVFLLIGVLVKTGSMEGVADDSDGVLSAFKGNIQFLRKYWVGKDELSGTEATGQTTISVKNAKKFAYGFSSSPAVAMKVAFETAAGVVDDNSGSGYTLAGVNVGANTIDISPALAGAGLAAGDSVYGFIPDVTDVGEEVNFYLGLVQRGESGDEDWTVIRGNYTMNNNHLKILDNEKNGLAYPNRILEAPGTGNLREAMFEIEYIENEDDTGLDYDAEQRIAQIIILPWGDPDDVTQAGSRFRITGSQVELEAGTESGDQEIHEVRGSTALGTAPDGGDEASMLFD